MEPEFSRKFSHSPHQLHFTWISFFCCSKGSKADAAIDLIISSNKGLRYHSVHAWNSCIIACKIQIQADTLYDRIMGYCSHFNLEETRRQCFCRNSASSK